jgi:hypothetical protein
MSRADGRRWDQRWEWYFGEIVELRRLADPPETESL